jgi:SAM-dependent methyltransferase
MSTVFSWKPENFDYLLASCEEDPLTPYIFKYFSRSGRILEAGCGAGRYVKYLHERGYDCTGIEYNQTTVENVREKWPELSVVQGDVEKMPYENETFDGVISIGVVEHFVEGPYRPLAEMLRVLKPGGIALITIPCLNRLRRLKGPFCGITHIVSANPLLRKMLGKKQLEHTGWNLYNPRYKWHVFPEWGDFYEYRFAPDEFKRILHESQYEILESIPLYQTDGLYHEFGRLFAKYVHCKFVVYPHGRMINRLFSQIPFFHNHMHLCVARKKNNENHN